MEHNDRGIEREPRRANMPWWKRLWRWDRMAWKDPVGLASASVYSGYHRALIASLFAQY